MASRDPYAKSRPRKSDRRTWLLTGVAAIALVVTGVILASSHLDAATPSPSPPSPSSATAVSAVREGFGTRPDPPVMEGGDEDEAALAELAYINSDDLTTVTPAGQWVAELAERSGAAPVEVLGEHQRMRREMASSDHPIVLLRTSDFGTASGTPRWVTVALGDFLDAGEVTAYCRSLDTPTCHPLQLLPR
ncbi:hypothetical protein [Actinoplanes sp. NPDC051851]|uniref:hypothetical protein n=1 Tax=Actinoplanes sp. NPDC051851 TaxID=3154753 RepID=UPI00342C0D3C